MNSNGRKIYEKISFHISSIEELLLFSSRGLLGNVIALTGLHKKMKVLTLYIFISTHAHVVLVCVLLYRTATVTPGNG